MRLSGLLRFQNTVTTNFLKKTLSWESDCYSYKKLPDKNSGFKNLEKSGRVATLCYITASYYVYLQKFKLFRCFIDNS